MFTALKVKYFQNQIICTKIMSPSPPPGLFLLFSGEGGFSVLQWKSRMKQCWCYLSLVSLIVWLPIRPSCKEQALNIVRQERFYLEASTIPSMDPGGFPKLWTPWFSVWHLPLLLYPLPTEQNPSPSLPGGLPSPLGLNHLLSCAPLTEVTGWVTPALHLITS